MIWVAGIVMIAPLVVEPGVENIVALTATVGLALAFALKDYVSCVIAGVMTIIENTYQPGDWIEGDADPSRVVVINFSRSSWLRKQGKIMREAESAPSETARISPGFSMSQGISPLGILIGVEQHPSNSVWPVAGETIQPIALEPLY